MKFLPGGRALTTLLLAALALTGCEAPVPAAPPVALRIGVYSSQDYLPYFVMRDQGFDRQYGLSFTETPIAGGAEGITLLAEGKADITLAALVPVLAAAERGLIPNTLIPVAANNFTDPEHPAMGILIAHHLRDWKDLEGQKIGTNALVGLMPAAAEIRLRKDHVSAYSFLVIKAPYRGLALAGGNIAAALMSEPYLTQSLLRGDGKMLAWTIGGQPFERMELSSILYGNAFRTRDPARAKAFLRAHLAAVTWINAHPDEARQLLAKRMNLSPELARQIQLARWPADARGDHVLNDQAQQILLQAGLIQRVIDTRGLYDESLLAEMVKEPR
jgi:NitT/TauT family transport system substrate-binding protein